MTDYQRGDVVIPVSDVYELLRLEMELSEEVAKVWLTTADMVFSLTNEDQILSCEFQQRALGRRLRLRVRLCCRHVQA